MTRVRNLITLVALLSLIAPGSVAATDEIADPDDEFLEFLGIWDEAWSEACEPEGGQAGDDSCLENDDDEQEHADNDI